MPNEQRDHQRGGVVKLRQTKPKSTDDKRVNNDAKQKS